MKPSRLYSNRPDVFHPVDFTTGLNVVMAEIRLPGNRNKDSHNPGKTTLGHLLDFGLLSKNDRKKFFLSKNPDLFSDFIFFLEIEQEDGFSITIRRSVKQASKIAFRKRRPSSRVFGILCQMIKGRRVFPIGLQSELITAIMLNSSFESAESNALIP